MGLASAAAAVLIIALTLTAGYQLMNMQSANDETYSQTRGRAMLSEQNRHSKISVVSFNSTNITVQVINTTLYVENIGSQNMETDCVDLYVDGAWVKKANISVMLKPTRFDSNIWNPSEILLLSSLQTLAVGEHNATVVACTGASAFGRFNASICGDSTCHGGEYCIRDNIACDLLCYITICEDGCNQTLTPQGEKDNFGLVCNETDGCPTNDCVCNGAGDCCGATGSPCTDNLQCCSGLCLPPSPSRMCSAYP
ncbi:MAG: hypothetical protein KKD39_05385 [Candidatus Altiarchaeota archaeon]|nr:hypothetical protein [Candidatus Altiarchaeota archaeon]